MSALFRDARLKIDRANKHIADLESAIFAYKTKHTSTINQNADTGIQELVHTIEDFESFALNAGLIAGDAIHNLHSALDIAWSQVIRLHVPSAHSPKNKFPVNATRESVEGRLRGIHVDTICPNLFDTIVNGLQPYKGAMDGGIIYGLHDLDISDKHILILGMSPIAEVKGIQIRDKDGQLFRGSGFTVEGAGPYIFAFESDINVENKGELSFNITVKDAGIFEGILVVSLLRTFSQYVSYAVQLLEHV